MKGRYRIIRHYFGLFDDKRVLCVTDDLMDAVLLCENLEKAYEGNLYSFDFQKDASDVDEGLDFYPGESLFSFGGVVDCKNLKEFKEKIKEIK